MSSLVPEGIASGLHLRRKEFLTTTGTGFGDPLIYLVPPALAFPPLLAYASRALGWPGGWVSTRVALVICIGLFLLLRLFRRDFSYYRIPGLWFVAPYVLLVFASVLWGVLGPYNAEASV